MRAVADLGLHEDLPADGPIFEPLAGGSFAPAPPGVLTLAVQVPDRAPFGVLRLRPTEPAADAEAAARRLAAHAAVAMEQSYRLRDVERLAEQLQDPLLPPLPEVPHTLLAVRYQAAATVARVGGDFYDAFPLADGRVLVVVGDVMGKNVESAIRASRISQTIRTLALQGLELPDLLIRTDELISFQDPQSMATVWLGLYEPESGELQFSSLGHPPALLLRDRERDTIRLEMEGLPMGMRDLDPRPPDVRSRLLQPRDVLALYTDGVVESSGDFLAGQQQLIDALAARREEPMGTVVDEVLAELTAEAGHKDDAVLFLLRRR